MPCTTILIGKNASFDGSTIVARNEDSPNGEFESKKFVVVQPADQPRHYRSVISHVEIDLPDNPMRYSSLPNATDHEGIWGEAGVNELNISMSETETLTTNERVLAADPMVVLVKAIGEPGEPGYVPEVPGGIGEEDMQTIVLPYIHSAREGVAMLGSYLERYGTYEMNGIAFSDIDEIWWLETVGGHHWIAKRVPDDAYVTVPNQLGIDSFDLDDAFGAQTDHMCSADLREFMADAHLDLRMDVSGAAAGAEAGAAALPGGIFNPREAFGSHSDSDHVYNTPRAWDMQRFLNPSAQAWGTPNAPTDGVPMGPESDVIPWSRVPERKITIEDVKYVLSRHFQGTEFDPYGKLGTPATRGMYRPVGINRNAQLSVVQLRPYEPEATRALQWVAYSSNAFNTLVPFFANVDSIPEYLANTTGDVTTESFYWANRIIAALADKNFGTCSVFIERYRMKVVSRAMALIREADRRVREEGIGYAEAPEVLGAANAAIADMLRRETDDLLGKVLAVASDEMRNHFSRSDG